MSEYALNALGVAGQWAGAIATFAAVLVVLRHDYWRRPKLRISFDNDRDVKFQDNTVGLKPPNRFSRWLRVRVVNDRKRRAAKNCRAYLTRIEWVQPGENVDAFENDVRQLHWMHDPPDHYGGRDLLPGVAHWVDVAGTADRTEGLMLCSYPDDGRTEPGEFIFTVQVSAEEAEPVDIKFLVRWDGTWQSLAGQPIQPAARPWWRPLVR